MFMTANAPAFLNSLLASNDLLAHSVRFGHRDRVHVQPHGEAPGRSSRFREQARQLPAATMELLPKARWPMLHKFLPADFSVGPAPEQPTLVGHPGRREIPYKWDRFRVSDASSSFLRSSLFGVQTVPGDTLGPAVLDIDR